MESKLDPANIAGFILNDASVKIAIQKALERYLNNQEVLSNGPPVTSGKGSVAIILTDYSPASGVLVIDFGHEYSKQKIWFMEEFKPKKLTYNKFLNVPGWLFSIKHLDHVKQLLDELNIKYQEESKNIYSKEEMTKAASSSDTPKTKTTASRSRAKPKTIVENESQVSVVKPQTKKPTKTENESVKKTKFQVKQDQIYRNKLVTNAELIREHFVYANIPPFGDYIVGYQRYDIDPNENKPLKTVGKLTQEQMNMLDEYGYGVYPYLMPEMIENITNKTQKACLSEVYEIEL